MKKSLLMKLTKMARDGDPEAIEALAEAVEELVAPESAEAVIAVAADPDPAPVPAAAPAPAAEAAEQSAATDEPDAIAAILERLDRIISLLAPATPADPAAEDEDPEPEAESPESLPAALAEVVEEAVGAVLEGEVPADESEALSAIVEEVVGGPEEEEPSTVLEPENESDACGNAEKVSDDVLRAAFSAVRPALRKMSRRDRKRVCADIAARLQVSARDSAVRAALAKAGAHRPENSADLGKRIMASRNPNYR